MPASTDDETTTSAIESLDGLDWIFELRFLTRVFIERFEILDRTAFVLCRILVRSRSGNRISDHGLSSYAEQSACTVRHIGIQHDGFHAPSSSENEVHGDTSVPRKNEMSKYPRLDPELDGRVMTRPVSVSRIQSNEQVPASVLGGRNPIFLDNLAAKHLHSIREGDFIELDDLID
ncbi:hypothetical protein ACFXTN_039436 [Malus domestica]